MMLSALIFLTVGMYLCQAQEMWIHDVEHGTSSFNPNPGGYQIYRNVMDFGCVGDGVTDDTACINTAISSGGRCGEGCGSSTISPALVYFPAGTYLISTPIIQLYYTQLVGNVNNWPTLVASPNFAGMAVIDSNPYGNGGNNWYTNQNNFFRQIRNFNIDLTRNADNKGVTGIHWQVAQATSLVNIHFIMSQNPGNQHQGIWMENGSGGFMSDLTFDGGLFGMWVGNQQFLSINLIFNNCQTAIYMNWNWQWTFKNVQINNCGVGIDMTAGGGVVTSGVGSILLVDSSITNTQVGVRLNANPNPQPTDVSGTLLLDNVIVQGTPAVVQDAGGATILADNGVIVSWGRGSFYQDESGNGAYQTGYLPNPNKSGVLLDGQTGRFFQKSRPQYGALTAADFASVKAGGAVGDGVTDDAAAIQNVINANVNGKVVYFPAGTYVVGSTINIPPGTRIIGETWSSIFAGGAAFQNEANPQPMFNVGTPGQVGSVEITDLMFGTKGAQPGAILVQWNIAQGAQGSAGMWDCHFRVGGTSGSNLQVGQCPSGGNYQPQCVGAHTLLFVSQSGSGYFENVWAWTADHDLDNQLAQGQVSLYTGRGVLVESTNGPVWLYGTQSEHNVLYQYQIAGANNVFMTMIQSETPYWQPGPPAPQPFTPNNVFDDPDYAFCGGNPFCTMSWGMLIINSNNVYAYGAGMYNFFYNYDQTCLNTESCQAGMVNLVGNTNLYFYNSNTKAATNIFLADNTRVIATQAANKNGFCQTVNALIYQ